MFSTLRDFTFRHLEYFLFLGMLVISLFIYDDYGITWDETFSRYNAIINMKYIFFDDPALLSYRDRDYGVAFEVPLLVLEKLFNLTDSRDIYLLRHSMTHLFFLISGLFLFKLLDFLYKNKLLATIGFLCLVLHPRLYAHSFFNSKDIPFMAMFIICFYLNALAFHKKTIRNFVFLGIGIAILINIRIMGVLLLGCVAALLLIDALQSKQFTRHLKLGAVTLLGTVATLYLVFPYLWADPIDHFLNTFQNMSKFRWNGAVLFDGKIISGANLNWTYLPVWFVITTPIFYLLAGLLGLLLLGVHFIKNPLQFIYNGKERNNLVFLICFFAPVMAIIVLKSVVYDGWRHLYFIYPPFVLLMAYGLHFLIKKYPQKRVATACALPLIAISVFMIQNHPFQQVYFNQFLSSTPAEQIRKTFELDYWGSSYKQSLEYILSHDPTPSIKIHAVNFPIDILPKTARDRVQMVPLSQATYFITNYRLHPQDYTEFEAFKYHSFKVKNNTLSEIFKLK